MNEYRKIELEPRINADEGRNFSTPESLALNVQKGLSFWEDFDCDTEAFKGVIIDTAGSPCLELKDIPLVISFFQQVLERQNR